LPLVVRGAHFFPNRAGAIFLTSPGCWCSSSWCSSTPAGCCFSVRFPGLPACVAGLVAGSWWRVPPADRYRGWPPRGGPPWPVAGQAEGARASQRRARRRTSPKVELRPACGWHSPAVQGAVTPAHPCHCNTHTRSCPWVCHLPSDSAFPVGLLVSASPVSSPVPPSSFSSSTGDGCRRVARRRCAL